MPTRLAAALGGPNPQRHGLLAWTYDPVALSTGTVLTGGTVYVARLHNAIAGSATKLYWHVVTAGATATAGQNWVGLYSLAGTRLAQVGVDADNTTGTKTSTISSTAVARDTSYWVAFLFNATTVPAVGRGTGAGQFAQLVNVGLAAAESRFAVVSTGATTLPASFTPSSLTTTNAVSLWGGIG